MEWRDNKILQIIFRLDLTGSVSLSLQIADGKEHPQGLGAIKDLTHRQLSQGLKS